MKIHQNNEWNDDKKQNVIIICNKDRTSPSCSGVIFRKKKIKKKIAQVHPSRKEEKKYIQNYTSFVFLLVKPERWVNFPFQQRHSNSKTMANMKKKNWVWGTFHPWKEILRRVSLTKIKRKFLTWSWEMFCWCKFRLINMKMLLMTNGRRRQRNKKKIDKNN